MPLRPWKCHFAAKSLTAVATCLLVLHSGGGVSAQEAAGGIAPSVAPATTPQLWQRIVLLGASVTAGFDMAHPLGGGRGLEYRFGNYIEAALAVPHDPVATHAATFFFMKPAETLTKQIQAAIAAQPTLVVGLDSLFWFCYGSGVSEAERIARFDSALRLLEAIQSPLILGDIPDATRAVGGILSAKQMPELATIAACNERLTAWAAGRSNVRIFPLSALMTAASTDDEVRLGNLTWRKGQSRVLLQGDNLHPSAAGLAGLAVTVLDAAAELAQAGFPDASVLRRDLQLVEDTAVALGKAEAAKRAELEKQAQP